MSKLFSNVCRPNWLKTLCRLVIWLGAVSANADQAAPAVAAAADLKFALPEIAQGFERRGYAAIPEQ